MSDQPPSVRDLTPEDVARGLTEGRMVLVDVREPNETALSWCRCRRSIPPSSPRRRDARWCLPAAPAGAR